MDNALIFRLRTLKCTNLVLQCQLRSLQQFKSPSQNSETQEIVLRFMAFEKKLLTDLAHAYLSSLSLQEAAHPATDDVDFVARVLFFRWAWASDAYRQVLTDLNPFDVAQDHNGSQAEAFEMALTMVRQVVDSVSDDQRYSRTKQFVVDNQHFIDALGSIDQELIDAVPHAEDGLTWRLLAIMFKEDYEDIGNWPGFKAAIERPEPDVSEDEAEERDELMGDAAEITQVDSEEHSSTWNTIMKTREEKVLEEDAQSQVDQLMDITDNWNVWEFCRMYRLVKQRPHNSELISPIFLTEAFEKFWKIIHVDEENGDSWQGIFSRHKYEGKQLSSIMDGYFTDNRLERMTVAYRRRIHESALLDPSYYLEYIPWSELNPLTNLDAAKGIQSDLSLELETCDADSLVSWSTADPQAAISHCFYINEDIYAYNVLNDFAFPGYLWGGKPVFRCRELGATQFCEQLRRFWSVWNDCAISQDPSSGLWLLLETLPGVKARALNTEYGAKAVRSFFGGLVVQHKQGYRHNPQILQELLGSAYDSSYKNFLRYIDSSELQLDGRRPIGEGSFGRVYKGVWATKPQRHGTIDDVASGEVALKIAFGPRQESVGGDDKFFEELRLVHTALAGATVGFVEFFGFTKLFVDGEGHLSQVALSEEYSAAFALVFDFASEGTILDHLKNVLVPGAISQNWESICHALSGVALGLKEIHAHNVVHRDLHPNNVLVTKEYFKNTSNIGYHYNLSDLGEGKSIQSSVNDIVKISNVQKFGMSEYQAPEISAEGYGPATDMYAFGQLAVDMIRLNYGSFIENDQEPLHIPAKLADILESCLDDNPGERLEAHLIAFMLDEVVEGIQDGTANWVDSEEFLSHSSMSSKLLSLASTFRSNRRDEPSKLVD